MAFLLASWFGCGPRVDCSQPGAQLVEGADRGLSCAEGRQVVGYIELLAGRAVQGGDEPIVLAAVAERFRSDPNGTRDWLFQVREARARIEAADGREAADLRTLEVYRASTGKGPIRNDQAELWSVQKRALAVWAKDDTEQIALTESDLEAWIRLASLCREVQGGGVIRISVADRVSVYDTLIQRFESGDRPAKLALASLGAVWPQVANHWTVASYDRQQAWVSRAPLPPPMTASSLGYADAVFQGDVAGLAASVFEGLGPLDVAVAH